MFCTTKESIRTTEQQQKKRRKRSIEKVKTKELPLRLNASTRKKTHTRPDVYSDRNLYLFGTKATACAAS